jgi:hypothetical protein
MMARVTAEVLALLQERQVQRKAALDAHLRDVQFAAGDEVLLDTKYTPLPSRSLLVPPLDGPFTVLACAWRVFRATPSPFAPHCTRVHGAQHEPPRHPSSVARFPGVQR